MTDAVYQDVISELELVTTNWNLGFLERSCEHLEAVGQLLNRGGYWNKIDYSKAGGTSRVINAYNLAPESFYFAKGVIYGKLAELAESIGQKTPLYMEALGAADKVLFRNNQIVRELMVSDILSGEKLDCLQAAEILLPSYEVLFLISKEGSDARKAARNYPAVKRFLNKSGVRLQDPTNYYFLPHIGDIKQILEKIGRDDHTIS